MKFEEMDKYMIASFVNAYTIAAMNRPETLKLGLLPEQIMMTVGPAIDWLQDNIHRNDKEFWKRIKNGANELKKRDQLILKSEKLNAD